MKDEQNKSLQNDLNKPVTGTYSGLHLNDSNGRSCSYNCSSFVSACMLYLQECGTLVHFSKNRSIRLPSYLLFIVQKGSGWIEYSGKRYSLSSGDVLFADCQNHSIQGIPEGNCTVSYVCWNGKNMPDVYSELCKRGLKPVFHPKEPEQFTAILDTLYVIASAGNQVSESGISESLVPESLEPESCEPESCEPESREPESRVSESCIRDVRMNTLLNELLELLFQQVLLDGNMKMTDKEREQNAANPNAANLIAENSSAANRSATNLFTANPFTVNSSTTKYKSNVRSSVVSASDVKAYIDTHYKEHLSLLSISEHFYMSKNHLAWKFKDAFGISMGSYIEKVRISKAKEMLKYTDETLDTIAIEVGYKDSNYFSKAFKKVEGVAPSVYRKNFWEKPI